MLIKKAVAVRKHLERSKKDKDAKFRLILIESRIHRYDHEYHSPLFRVVLFLINGYLSWLLVRLARYYRSTRKLEGNWKYESATASALVA